MEFTLNGDWLWEACWHKSRRESFEAAMLIMGGESMMMMPAPMEAMSMVVTEPIVPVVVEEPPIIAEPTAEEQMAAIEDILFFLDDIWVNDEEVKETISQQRWDEFIEALETMLDELENDF